MAQRLAEEEFDKFRVVQDHLFESDFEREAKKITTREPKKRKPKPQRKST